MFIFFTNLVFAANICSGDIHKLRVGEEIMDHCHYLLHGLKSPLSYEVKISYPASVCSLSLMPILASIISSNLYILAYN